MTAAMTGQTARALFPSAMVAVDSGIATGVAACPVIGLIIVPIVTGEQLPLAFLTARVAGAIISGCADRLGRNGSWLRL